VQHDDDDDDDEDVPKVRNKLVVWFVSLIRSLILPVFFFPRALPPSPKLSRRQLYLEKPSPEKVLTHIDREQDSDDDDGDKQDRYFQDFLTMLVVWLIFPHIFH
jgi:hypothetical protein